MSNELMNGSKKRKDKEDTESGATLADPRRSDRRKRGRTLRLAVLSSLTSLLALASLPAHSALITINETIDISGYTSGSGRWVPLTPGEIRSGDRVDMTVNFSNNQALIVSNWYSSHVMYSFFYSNTGNIFYTVENIAVSFLGFSETGGAPRTLTFPTQYQFGYYLGPNIHNFLSPGQSIQFTGYNVTYDVTSLSTDPTTYSSLYFAQWSPNLAVVSVPVPEAVPEPGVLSLLALGLAGLAVAQRRKAGPRRGAYPA